VVTRIEERGESLVELGAASLGDEENAGVLAAKGSPEVDVEAQNSEELGRQCEVALVPRDEETRVVDVLHHAEHGGARGR
jgi:hypothetical protein